MNTDYLDFEQPIADLEVKINELRLVGADNKLNITEEIENLQEKSHKLTTKIFSSLSPWQISMLARHPLRPQTEDYIRYMCTEFEELHGDRMFADDQSILSGVAYLVFPRYGIAIDAPDNSVIIADSNEVHGVTPITGTGERFTCVAYCDNRLATKGVAGKSERKIGRFAKKESGSLEDFI